MDQSKGPMGNPLMNVNKPNPYVIVETKDDEDNGDGSGAGPKQSNDGGPKKEIVFKYPKSKIFVGGLDFKVDNAELKQHFQQFGQIESAVILKDINTGQSRGFGFVTFKEEAVAQDLIQHLGTTTIQGRKVDIKSAEPKQQNSSSPAPIIPKRIPQGEGNFRGGGSQFGGDRGRPNGQGGYAMIPQYGDGDERKKNQEQGDFRNDGDSSNSDNYRGGRDQGADRRGNRDRDGRDYRDRDHNRDRRSNRDGDRHEDRGDDREKKRSGNRGGDYHSRLRDQDSADSRDSSSSYQRNRDRRSKRDKDSRRGPHHGASMNYGSRKDETKKLRDNSSQSSNKEGHPSSTNKTPKFFNGNRSRSRSNR